MLFVVLCFLIQNNETGFRFILLGELWLTNTICKNIELLWLLYIFHQGKFFSFFFLNPLSISFEQFSISPGVVLKFIRREEEYRQVLKAKAMQHHQALKKTLDMEAKHERRTQELQKPFNCGSLRRKKMFFVFFFKLLWESTGGLITYPQRWSSAPSSLLSPPKRKASLGTTSNEFFHGSKHKEQDDQWGKNEYIYSQEIQV